MEQLPQEKSEISRLLGFSFLCDGKNSIQFGNDFRINFLLGHKPRESMIICFPQQVRQAKFLEEAIKEWVQEIITGFHVGRPRIRPAQSLKCYGQFLNTITHGLHAPICFSVTE